jgi:ABC-type multidrug transport system fused ATPase/permease subunit
MQPLWKYCARMARHRWTLALAMFFAFISAGGLGVGLLGLVPVLDNILGKGVTLPELAARINARTSGVGLGIPQSLINALPTGQFDAVLWLICALIGLTIVGAFANYLHSYLALTVSTQTVAEVRDEVFKRVLHLPLLDLQGRTNDTVSRLLTDANLLQRGLTALTGKAVAQVTKGVFALVAAFVIDWRLSISAMLVSPLLYLVIRKVGRAIRRASKGALKAQSELLEAATEGLHGLRVVKVHTAESLEMERFSARNRDVVREQFRVRTARAIASPLTETIAVIALGLLSLLAARAIISGAMAPANFMVALAALAAAGNSLKPLTTIVQDLYASAAAAQRIDGLMDLAPEPTDEWSVPGATDLPRHARSIEFERIAFTYPGAEGPALDGVSLSIHHGETIAFVGPNGSGKTTLLSLIPRLLEPSAGAVRIDGRDVRAATLRSVRRQIGVVTQETVLFRGSFADNIAYGSPGADRAAIEHAARIARADEFIRQKGGYDAPLAERAQSLSGGQRQRLAIARAVHRDPAILILDEATSMLDADSEHKIAEAIDDFSSGRTCLIVAHRLSTVLHADRIVVMDRGRIVDVGRHDELLERCPLYATLARRQLIPATV